MSTAATHTTAHVPESPIGPAPNDADPVRPGTGDEFAEQLWVEWWPEDPVTATDVPARFARGTHALTSTYVEHYWLPVLGPSSVMFLRRLAMGLDEQPAGFALWVPDIAVALGIGHRGGRNGPMSRTLQRCCSFGITRVDHGHQLLVRRGLPALSPRQLARLPRSLQSTHAHHNPGEHELRPTPTEEQRQRCRTLALSLLDLGEDVTAAERQLHRWRFHPAMAYEAVQWAAQRQRARSTA